MAMPDDLQAISRTLASLAVRMDWLAVRAKKF